MQRTLVGKHWEQQAESFLHQHGLKTQARNVSSRWGEIDLVMTDKDALVFVEVRYRKSNHYGSGAASVTRAKQKRLINTAKIYLSRHPAQAALPCRFDVISITDKPPEKPIEWIKNAFYED